MFVRAYLRASTDEQDATRAQTALEKFATDQGLVIAATYIENESGTKDWMDRPELRRLLNDCKPGDILLVEQVDRLTRLNAKDWEALKAEILRRKVKIVAKDLETSWQFAKSNGDETTARIFDAINNMMLDVLAAVARKDYDDRVRRQKEGISKAHAKGLYRGRKEDEERNRDIMNLLARGTTWKEIQRIYERPVLKRGKQVMGKDGKPRTTTVSKVTISKLKKRLEEEGL